MQSDYSQLPLYLYIVEIAQIITPVVIYITQDEPKNKTISSQVNWRTEQVTCIFYYLYLPNVLGRNLCGTSLRHSWQEGHIPTGSEISSHMQISDFYSRFSLQFMSIKIDGINSFSHVISRDLVRTKLQPTFFNVDCNVYSSFIAVFWCQKKYLILLYSHEHWKCSSENNTIITPNRKILG